MLYCKTNVTIWYICCFYWYCLSETTENWNHRVDYLHCNVTIGFRILTYESYDTRWLIFKNIKSTRSLIILPFKKINRYCQAQHSPSLTKLRLCLSLFLLIQPPRHPPVKVDILTSTHSIRLKIGVQPQGNLMLIIAW